ncbi:MAG: signal peptidase I [Acidobacteriota bacterium]|nr:signal peptidase I [Acidobacteriota bacterium]
MSDRFDAHAAVPAGEGGSPAWFELLLTVLGALALAVLFRLFVAETYEIPSGSMLETIQLGDRLLGEKVTLRWDPPAAGDVVTFNDPDGSGSTLIKRVIATEGQVVDLQDGYVIVDGRTLEEDYVLDKPSYALDGHASNLSENVSFPFTVPAGCLWVMGDNRTNSLDSRYFGAIPVSSVTSKALFIYWPLPDARTL